MSEPNKEHEQEFAISPWLSSSFPLKNTILEPILKRKAKELANKFNESIKKELENPTIFKAFEINLPK